MKRRYIAIGMLVLALKGKSQAVDSSYVKRNIPKTDIEVVFSMYDQKGDHSAVTGGKGTEKLRVYAPGINLDFQGTKSSFSLAGGADIISSASTDRIDYVMSSASKVDTRTHADIQYTHQIGKNGVEVGLGTGISIESDYLSVPVRAAFNYAAPNGMRQVQASFSAYFDDLRWGRLNPGYRRPVKLIYPSELRYKEWYNIHNRYTYNFKTGIVQVINKRLIAAFYPEFIMQRGLLATPFHRVYFTDDSVKVEKLPKQRNRIPMGIKANYFAGSRTVLKAAYNFYRDDFGITGHGANVEVAIKVSPMVTLSPFAEFYGQSASKYFRPYGAHDPGEKFYSSDYDLSKFNSIKVGLGFRWAPFQYLSKRSIFNEINLRYAYFGRSDGLKAHMLTASFGFSRPGKEKLKRQVE